ncbi:prepilin-type N-terminal cleavage/methylation domain-containing protein [Luteolibacter sp. SL250]|uniref:prepilin-type N-terminal cleavage/methylation domain-containing protein n=1 Tax=Luteolibacter sp. SL250 TaxID=2995170 RepID=UPI00226D771B|nr:prepilin-type N-terminal cleavage/methylation domain-containing protein [Luteolibacter sp. SL250]WAC19666.1 prepilin-type N-terminal cleavage/methylation domain-containing protein [Luteolibacter sp. SL250]
MKTQSIHRRSGFTLIELLVVIAIIAVLASAGFGVGMKVQNTARKQVAESAARNVVHAVNSFYADYSAMPVPTGTASTQGGTTFGTESGDGLKILDILLGLEDEINTKKVKYLDVPEAKSKKKGGLVFNKSGKEVSGMFDPWGNPFFIVLDTDYAERLEFKPSKKQETLNGRRCAVYSAGQDKKIGTADDVKTW